MYQEAFDFNGRPFTMAPFVKHFFNDSPVRQSLDQINESISRDAGPSIVVGHHGSGKSLLLALLSEHYQQSFKVISLSCGPMAERRDLLQAILFELKQPYHDLSEGELRLSLIDFIKPTDNCPNGVLLLVDDAQALTPDLVEELRLITNFVRDGVPRVRLVLCGTSRLEEVLTEPKLEAFNQRLSTRCFLGNLTREQTHAYIQEHVNRVGGNAEMMFARATTSEIHDATSGCPRFINQLAEQCMISAATHGSLVVEPQMVASAWALVQGLPTTESSAIAPTQADSSDENWTVIEFGSLDDETDSGSFSESEQPQAVADETTEAVADVDEFASNSDSEISEMAADGTLGFVPPAPETNDAVWNDGGTSDPFVSNESESITETTNEIEPESDEQSSTPTDDAYSYQSLNPEPPDDDVEPQDENGSPSIPTEFRDLNQDQEETWAAAGSSPNPDQSDLPAQDESLSASVASDTPANESPDTETQDNEESGFSAAQALGVALPTIPAIAAAVSVANPFAEAFESEEPVEQEIDELIAEQNTSSAQVTGSQLDHLPMSDFQADSDGGIPVVSLTDEVQETEETYAPIDALQTQEPVGDVDPDDAQPTPLAEEPALEEQPVEEQAFEAQETEEPVNKYTVDDVASVFGTMGDDDPYAETIPEPLPEPELEQATTTPGYEFSDDTQLTSPPATVEYHEHDTSEPTADVQQQADEIMSAIQVPAAPQADSVSEPAPSQVEAEQEVIQDNVELSDAQRILSEILEHKNLLHDQVSLSENSSNLTAGEPEFPQSVSMTQPYGAEEVSSDSTDNHAVAGTHESTSSQDAQRLSNEQTPDPTPPSTGRAQRMDYERLFEQLRDDGNQQ